MVISKDIKEKVIKILKDINGIKNKIEILKLYLNDLNSILGLTESDLIYYYECDKSLGSVGAYDNSSIVEKEVIYTQNSIVKIKSEIKMKILKTKSEIFYYERLMNYVNLSIKSLDKYEEYIVNMIYFTYHENKKIYYSWNDIEKNFNEFRKKNNKCEVTRDQINNFRVTAINKICNNLCNIDVVILYK